MYHNITIFGNYWHYTVNKIKNIAEARTSNTYNLKNERFPCDLYYDSSAILFQTFSDFNRSERNIIEAASNGATMAVKLIVSIIVNLIAFIAIIEFFNQTLIWFGSRLELDPSHPAITFQVGTSKYENHTSLIICDECKKKVLQHDVSPKSSKQNKQKKTFQQLIWKTIRITYTHF